MRQQSPHSLRFQVPVRAARRRPLRQAGRLPLRSWRAAATLFLALPGLCGGAPGAADEPPSSYSIHWVPGQSDARRVSVEVSGLSAETVDGLRRASWDTARWQKLLAVYADQGDLTANINLPPMLGAYRIGQAVLRFEPQFPLEPGVKYRAVFRSAQLPGMDGGLGGLMSSTYQLAIAPPNPTTVVRQVYPTADVLPENLLKFYVHFSAPMSRGHIYDHIRLVDEKGGSVELPFLEIDEELWDPTMTRLTLFIDPGRIKRGVRPLEEIGPALEAGKRYTLIIGREWRDGTGNPLKAAFRKSFRVGPPDRDPPDPAEWKIQPPRSSTRAPLLIVFPEPMDHALAQRMIRVMDASGGLLAGDTALMDQERRWSFTPATAWSPGAYRVSVQTTIEDLAGNNIGKPFEVDLFEGVQRRLTNETVALPFEVR
jgi:hypothetical protein